MQVRFRGGTTRTLTLPLPPAATQTRRTAQPIVDEIDRLLDDHTDAGVAAALNARGRRSFDGKPFHALMVAGIRKRHRLTDRFSRLRARGLLTVAELAADLGVGVETVERWRDGGLLHAERYNDKGECLYYRPEGPTPVKWKRKFVGRETSPASLPGGAV